MTLGSSFFSHVERYFRKDDLLVRKMTPLKNIFICHSLIWHFPNSVEPWKLELSYIPQMTSCIPLCGTIQLKKKNQAWEVSARTHN